MERMINNRFVWYLERNKIITPAQSGFRKGRSTTEQLVRLVSFVREAFIQKQHVTAIFFDLEKLTAQVQLSFHVSSTDDWGATHVLMQRTSSHMWPWIYRLLLRLRIRHIRSGMHRGRYAQLW